jgi:hypothetical protein
VSAGRIRRLATALPQVINAEDVSSVTDEWKLYAVDSILQDWYTANDNISHDDTASATRTATVNSMSANRIDDYWSKVLQMRTLTGALKYETLGKVVMATLALSHGNADAERSFSFNKKVVTPQRVSLTDDSIRSVRLVKDAMHCHAEGKATGVAITPALLRSARSAYSLYKQHLEEEKKRRN